MNAGPLAPEDLPRAAALSALIGWNQNAADWQLFLDHGEVRALDGPGDALPATAAFIRYGDDVAWISMVLVRPDQRRRGLATALMRWAVDRLETTRCTALDATPAGREVYRQLGFADVFGFRRWALPAALPAEPGVSVRPVCEADWPAVCALDAAAFGAQRDFLLCDFARRLPCAALVAENAHGIAGFALARDGVRGPQIGPVMARDAAVGGALIAAAAAALMAPAVIDVLDAQKDIATWLTTHGASEQRPFTRMIRGGALPGDPTGCIAVAGPEFG